MISHSHVNFPSRHDFHVHDGFPFSHSFPIPMAISHIHDVLQGQRSSIPTMPFLGVEVIFVSNPAACVCYPALPQWCEGMILGYFWVGFVLLPPAPGDADTGAAMLVLIQGQ